MIEPSQCLKKTEQPNSRQRIWQVLAPAAIQIQGFLCSVVLSIVPLAGGASPFALALSAAAPQGLALSVGAGAVTGYAANLDLLSAARYLAAVCVVATLRWLLQILPYHRMIAAFAGGASLFGMQMILSRFAAKPFGWLTGGAEWILTVALCWLFCHLPARLQTNLQQTIAEQGAMLVLGSGLLAGLSALQIQPISPGWTAGAFLLLAVGYTGGKASMPFACLSFIGAMILTGDGLFAALGIFISAFAAVQFAQERKKMVCAFCCASPLVLAIAPTVSLGFSCLSSELAAAVIFLAIPQKAWNRFSSMETCKPDIKKNAIYRVEKMSRSLTEISSLVRDICALTPKKIQQNKEAAEYVCNTICNKCDKNTFCWVERYHETVDVLNAADLLQKQSGYLSAEELPQFFRCRCHHVPLVCGALSKCRAMQMSERAAMARNDLLCTALTEQYGALAQALEQMIGELQDRQRMDDRRTEQVKKLYEDMQLMPLDIQVTRNQLGRLQILAHTHRVVLNEEEQEALETEIRCCCERNLKLISCIGEGAATSFLFLEQPLLKTEYGCTAIPAKGGISADVADCFCDEKGQAHMLLCDGMGTGSGAAIDGKMAAFFLSKLLLAGFQSEVAARLVNVALQLKGREEGGAAIDAVTVDLYSGKAKFFKAGAAPTFLIRGQRVEKLFCESLPIGTSGISNGAYLEQQLQPEDIVVMLSDGVLSLTEGKMKEYLLLHAADSPEKLADSLADCAKKQSGRADDITVSVLCLKKVC